MVFAKSRYDGEQEYRQILPMSISVPEFHHSEASNVQSAPAKTNRLIHRPELSFVSNQSEEFRRRALAWFALIHSSMSYRTRFGAGKATRFWDAMRSCTGFKSDHCVEAITRYWESASDARDLHSSFFHRVRSKIGASILCRDIVHFANDLVLRFFGISFLGGFRHGSVNRCGKR